MAKDDENKIDRKNKAEWRKYVELLMSMATDELLEKGPTKRALINNLRTIATQMEALLPPRKFEHE